MGGIVKSISYAVVSNGVSFVSSALITLIVPKILSVESYGYFQLYLFYLSYIGFCCFGWVDGIVLRYAGRYYESLNYSSLKTQFIIFCITQMVISGAFMTGVTVLVEDSQAREVYLLLGVAIVFSMPCSFLRYLLQAVGKIREYSINLLLERVVYTGLVLIALAVGIENFFWLIIADLIGKAISLFESLFECKEIIKAPRSSWYEAICEGKRNVSCGVKLLVANGASLFIVGIVRYAVQVRWDVVAFAKVSFALSISNLFMVFIRAVSVVLLPNLKRTQLDRLPDMYQKIRSLLMVVLFAMLTGYYPLSKVLGAWLPQYAESLRYMGLLFPICIFESKNTLLIETYLKAYRKEKILLAINCLTVLLSLALTGITVFILSDLNLAMLSVVVLLWFRCTVSEIYIEKVTSRGLKKDIAVETYLVITFIFCSWFMRNWQGSILYFGVYIAYLLVYERKNMCAFIATLRRKR